MKLITRLRKSHILALGICSLIVSTSIWAFRGGSKTLAKDRQGHVLTADTTFECVIASDRTIYAVGEVPKITSRIINKSGKYVVLVGRLDNGGGAPQCYFQVRDASGRRVTQPRAGCGVTSWLKASDFVVVPTDQAFDPFGEGFLPPDLWDLPVGVPGDYYLTCYYSTAERIEDYFGGAERAWGGKASPEIQRQVERVPKLNLKSNVLKLTFTAKPK